MEPRPIQWLSANKFLIELALLALVGISFFLHYRGLSGGAEALMFCMMILSGFYLFSAFFMVQIDSVLVAIMLKVFSVGSSVCIVALLFTILRLPGAREMLLIGTMSIGVSGVIILYNIFTTKASKFFPLLVRMIILGGVSLSTLFALQNQA
jgi:hypothetical protein